MKKSQLTQRLYSIFENVIKYIFLFMTFGFLYIAIELMFRGYSHWTMFICGGVSSVEIGLLNEVFKWETPIWKQMACGALIITANEFMVGCIVNLWLGLNIWDYTDMPFNVLGQICLPFILIWFVLSYIAIVVDDYLRWAYFEEEFPRYNYKFK